jgi:hypothetical protein
MHRSRPYTSSFSTDYTNKVLVPNYVDGMQRSCYYSYCCAEHDGIPFGYNPQRNVRTNVKMTIDDYPYHSVNLPWYQPYHCEPPPVYDNTGNDQGE